MGNIKGVAGKCAIARGYVRMGVGLHVHPLGSPAIRENSGNKEAPPVMAGLPLYEGTGEIT